MNATFEYYFRLTRFKNIDLPLQGLYFIQFRFESASQSEFSIQIVPYSANRVDISPQIGNPVLHSLFPPQISPDDSLQSSGFIIQFSEESVALSDSFRIYLKDNMYLTKGGENGIPSLCGSVKSFDQTIRLHADLLFSGADELGGVSGFLNRNVNIDNFPTEYTVVASQRYLIQPPGSGAEFLRIPLGLLRENAVWDESLGLPVGDVYPCAFVEGVLCSVMTQILFPSSTLGVGMTEFIQRMSDEWGLHPLEVEDCILRNLALNLETVSVIARELELQITCTNQPDPGPIDSSPHVVQESAKMLTEATFKWNSQIINNFPVRPRLDRLKSVWRKRLIKRARTYFYFSDETDTLGNHGTDFEQLLFPIHTASIPRLRVQIANQSPGPSHHFPSHPGAHLIILVHGYQGSSYDVRVIRNQVACLCPDALIFSSSSNESFTDGDLKDMGLRLANEVQDFIDKHSTPFYIISRISFIAHSLGGLIVRSALPFLVRHKSLFNIFVTLSSPHVGITDRFIESGVLFLRLFKKSTVLEQLTLRDAYNLEDCELYRLASLDQIAWFRRVLLVGSNQDRYAPISTSILSESCADISQRELQVKLKDALSKTLFETIDVSFDIPESPTLDNILGRAAHIKFLESPILIELIFLYLVDMVDID